MLMPIFLAHFLGSCGIYDFTLVAMYPGCLLSSARSFTIFRKVIGTVAAMTCYEIIQVPTVRQLSVA